MPAQAQHLPLMCLVAAVTAGCLDARTPSAAEYRLDPSFVALQVDSAYALPATLRQAGEFSVFPQAVATVTGVASAGSAVEYSIVARRPGFAVLSGAGNYPLLWIAATGSKRSGPLLIGHHGVPFVAPENTLAGVNVACQRRLPGIEVDVRFTRDSVPVLIHDREVARTSNGSGFVDLLTLAQLRQLDFGSWFSSLFVGEQIPTLDEFLKVAATCDFDVIMLDVKTFAPLTLDGAWAVMGRMAAEAGLSSRLVLGYAEPRALQRARALIPSARTVLIAVPLDSATVRTVLEFGISAVAFDVDRYRQTGSTLGRLQAAGVVPIVYGLAYPLEANTLDPFPGMVISDWGWQLVP